MNNLDRVNALAERSPGFVWRLEGDNNNATEFRIGDDMAVNLSVWRTAKALETYVFKTVHVQFYKQARRLVRAHGKAAYGLLVGRGGPSARSRRGVCAAPRTIPGTNGAERASPSAGREAHATCERWRSQRCALTE